MMAGGGRRSWRSEDENLMFGARLPDASGSDEAISVRRIRIILILVVLLAALIYAWHLRWVSEDAYISFRYARNLIEGHGLVFNVGERVEGYTNFLWTVLLALGLSAGAGPEAVSVALGMGFTAVTFLCLFRLHRLLFRGGERFVFPAALFALALNYSWASYSTSGLETSLLSASLAAAFLCLADWSSSYESSKPNNRYLGAVGGLIALAMMTRPDAVLVLPAAVLFVLLHRSDRRMTAAHILFLAAPLAAIYLPYFVWRLDYYGHVFPNTYYAKSASLPYFSQGLTYLWEFARRYFLWAFFPVLLAALWRGFRSRCVSNPLIWMMAAYCLLHSLYVVRVGGDFMEGRLFIPIVPFLYLLIERSVREVVRPRPARAVFWAVLILSTAVNNEVIEPGRIRRGITDERSWVPAFKAWYREGVVFGKHLPPDTIVATDAVGAFGYASRLPIIDTVGLTDETVAHEPLERRSRPGHEKAARLEYLISRNAAVLRDGMNRYYVDRTPAFQYAGNRYFLLTDDEKVIEGFRRAAAELMTESR
jgi:arabinofuranosyltransferase